MGSFVGALIATYFLSRLILRFAPPFAPALRLFGAHLLSFLLLALFVGLLKAYATLFAAEVTLVFLGPQILWLVVDVVRGKAGPLAFYR